MPQLGEIARGRDIGRKGPATRYLWHACERCGTERWTTLVRGEPIRHFCRRCAQLNGPSGKNHHLWKTGRSMTRGYVVVAIQDDDPFFSMSKTHRRILEHRLVMARYLGRCLESWEIVHHRNGVKDDNRIENLALLTGRHEHASFNLLQAVNKRLEQRIEVLEKRLTLLEAENVALKTESF